MTFEDLLKKYNMTFKEVGIRFDIPYRTVQNWHLGTRECPSYVINMIDEILSRES